MWEKDGQVQEMESLWRKGEGDGHKRKVYLPCECRDDTLHVWREEEEGLFPV